jgi:hypothetical protein
MKAFAADYSSKTSKIRITMAYTRNKNQIFPSNAGKALNKSNWLEHNECLEIIQEPYKL